ncbi:uncharacterized protein RCO7_02793 [Rhynchosporium graminicola]|uniref:2EXR domain-containing protein n=1 Tax=Rhynchosporium graminicola TaxID=2792576 RepID=A0A1E1KST4_9HELO|nr:uncharacterized protein RCO7_02793 [Rhynchosporium commune]
MESHRKDTPVMPGASGFEKTAIQHSPEDHSSRSFVDVDTSALAQASTDHPASTHWFYEPHNISVPTPTRDLEHSHDQPDFTNLVKNLNPDDYLPVRASELKAMLDHIRKLKGEVAAKKRHACVLLAFTLFPKLPLELRLKVWIYALHSPETLIFNQASKKQMDRHIAGGLYSHVMRYMVVWPVSKTSIMQVNVEARKEGEMVLAQCCNDEPADLHAENYKSIGCVVLGGTKCWHNPNTDTAFFCDATFSRSLVKEFPRSHNIKSLTLTYRHYTQISESPVFDYGARGLHEIFLAVGYKDLRVKKDMKNTVTATSKPDDFHLSARRGFPISGFTWEMMGQEEMRRWEEKVFKVTLWKQKVDGHTQDYISREWPQTNLDYTVPVITFKLLVGNAALLRPN